MQRKSRFVSTPSTYKIKKVVFLTGTRADFGKLKPLMVRLQSDPQFEVHVFVTGMHMLSKYGYTCSEVEKSGFKHIHKYFNQNPSDSMDHILAKTVTGLSDYMRETKPDLLVIHGDRVEALAGATVGALNNFVTAHVEGGEVSGTVDELIRHAVTKLSHVHFVSNELAKTRLIQLGERADSVHVIGSPDIDVMNSSDLPPLEQVKQRYDFNFNKYGILLFHPVTTELDSLQGQVSTLVDSLLSSSHQYVVIYPNNDHGSDLILSEYSRLKNNSHFKIYPSMRFEYFLTLLKNASFIIGNSSAGVREAPHYGINSINLGTRQNRRLRAGSILDVPIEKTEISRALESVVSMPKVVQSAFGDGQSTVKFHSILSTEGFWTTSTQKFFIDRKIKNT